MPNDRIDDALGSDAGILPTMDSAGVDRPAAKSGFAAPRVPGYRVIALLGRGAMGTVWQAHDLTLERDVAIKLLNMPPGEEDAASARVLREARAAGRLDHPNAVRLHHVARDGSQISIVMELLAGGSLSDLIERDGPMTWREATMALREAAEGLGAAHAAGLVHRDVKPSNLLRSRSGRVKVADFGVARAGGLQSQLTTPGAIIGTPAYMAPEQCRGEEAGLQCDLYGLGCTYYHLLTGGPPFTGDSTSVMYQHCHEPFPDASKLAPGLPPAVLAILERLTRKSPADRYGSTADLIADLDRLLLSARDSQRIAAQARGVGTSRPAYVGRVVAIVVLINVGIAGGLGLWRWSHRRVFPSKVQELVATRAASSLPAMYSVRALISLSGNIYPIAQVGFSPDDRFVWSSCRDTNGNFEARRWNVESGAPAGQNYNQGWGQAISPSGDLILNGRSDGGSIQGINASTPSFHWPATSFPFDISFDGRLIANGEGQADGGHQIVVRTVADGKEWFRIDRTLVNDGKFSPDIHFLIIDDGWGSLIPRLKRPRIGNYGENNSRMVVARRSALRPTVHDSCALKSSRTATRRSKRGSTRPRPGGCGRGFTLLPA